MHQRPEGPQGRPAARSDAAVRPHERGFPTPEGVRTKNAYRPSGPWLPRSCLRTLPGIQRLAKAIDFEVLPTK